MPIYDDRYNCLPDDELNGAQPYELPSTCPDCGGNGIDDEGDECPTCDGTGIVDEEEDEDDGGDEE